MMKVDEHMLLRNGVTGFWDDHETAPESKEKSIRSKVFTLLTYDGHLKVEQMDCGYPKNYMHVVLSFHGSVSELYINLYYEYLYLDHVSASNLHRSKLPPGTLGMMFHRLTDSQVRERVAYLHKDKLDVLEVPHELNNAEVQQILYFRPSTMFDVLFNEWD